MPTEPEIALISDGVFFSRPAPLPRGKHNIARDEVQAAQRERRRSRWVSAAIVVAPVALALVYVLWIATPRYEAESRFFVQSASGQQSGGGGAANLLTTGNMAGMLGG